MIPDHPGAILPPEPTASAMLLVRSPQQAQGLELIQAGEREARRWKAVVKLLKSSQWGWMTGFAPCAQRILGVGSRRDRMLRQFSVDCALQTWRWVPVADPTLKVLWPRPWKTARETLGQVYNIVNEITAVTTLTALV